MLLLDLLAWLLGYSLILSLVACAIAVLAIFTWGAIQYAIDRCSSPPTGVLFVPKGQVKRIAVIGAGPSGIGAAKEALGEGIEVVIFEQTKDIGGVWVFREKEGASGVYKSTFINTSRQMMSYSDYPMPSDFPTFPHHRQLVKYFNDYAKHFDVFPRIRFNTQVIRMTPLDEGKRWEVESKSNPDGRPLYMQTSEEQRGESTIEYFDAVVVSTGHHCVPHMPPAFPGQDSFRGIMYHSHSYKDPTNPVNLHDKRVVVVGIGGSGVDIASELSRYGKQVYLSTRSGAWVLPKYINGRPFDHVHIPSRLLLMLVPNVVLFNRIMLRFTERAVERVQGDMRKWGLNPQGRLHQTHPTISQELLHRIGSGTVTVKPNIASLGPDSVTFTDGTTVRCDAIVFCTGYKISFPFLDKKLFKVQNNAVHLYKYVFSPTLPITIAFTGLIQPRGAIMPVSEMQARWAMQIWTGRLGLPNIDCMNADIHRKQAEMRERYLDRQRHTIQVEWPAYTDEIAHLIGAYPSLWSNLPVLKELLFCPVLPVHYRLNGPRPWEGARECTKRMYAEIREGKEGLFEASAHVDDDECSPEPERFTRKLSASDSALSLPAKKTS